MSSSGGSSSRSSRRQHQLWPEHSPVNISVMEGGDRVGRSVWQTQTDQHHQPPSLNSIRSDSGMNSMEYWDYTVELECIGQTPGTSSLPPPSLHNISCRTRVCVLTSSALRSLGQTNDPDFYFWIVHTPGTGDGALRSHDKQGGSLGLLRHALNLADGRGPGNSHRNTTGQFIVRVHL